MYKAFILKLLQELVNNLIEFFHLFDKLFKKLVTSITLRREIYLCIICIEI